MPNNIPVRATAKLVNLVVLAIFIWVTEPIANLKIKSCSGVLMFNTLNIEFVA